MPPLNTSEIKALFDQLVSAVGTQDAAATFLGVSRQRVGQLISTANNDLPTVTQIAKLEEVCGQSIVFGALARRVEAAAAKDALASSIAAASAASTSVAETHAALADGQLCEGEVDRVQDRARESLASAQANFDAAMKLQPTIRTVQ